MTEETKNPAAVELGKLGGKKTAERGSEYYAEINAKRQVRAGGRPRNPPKAAHEGLLKIGSSEMACAVLEDGTRLLSQRAFSSALGAPSGGSAFTARRTSGGVAGLPIYLAHENLKSFIDKDLEASLNPPLVYIPMHGGRSAFGLKAELVPAICDVWLRAREAGVLTPRQLQIAGKAELLVRGLAHVGIIALVDEATGYQYVRTRSALEEIFEKFLTKEFGKWAKRFPDEFYRQMFRVWGWEYKEDTVRKTQLVGKITRNLVYDRLAPGIRTELEARNPKNQRGHRKAKHHQLLTTDVGHPALREHLSAVIALLRATDDDSRKAFMSMMDRSLPKYPDITNEDNVIDDRQGVLQLEAGAPIEVTA
jgi:hypothetical protein